VAHSLAELRTLQSTKPSTTNKIFNMKTLGAISTVVAAATVFASSVYGQLDPIVIKVESFMPSVSTPLTNLFQGSKFFYKTNGTEL
jgi:short-subunit dehydrogenase